MPETGASAVASTEHGEAGDLPRLFLGGEELRPGLRDLEPAPGARLRVTGSAPALEYVSGAGFRAARGLYLRCVARPGHTVLRTARLVVQGPSGETVADIRPEVFLGRSQFVPMRDPVRRVRVELGDHQGLLVPAWFVLEARPPLAGLRHVARVALDRSGNSLFRKLRTAFGLIRSEGLAGIMQRVHSTGHALGLEENKLGDPSRSYVAWDRLYGAATAPSPPPISVAALLLRREADTEEDVSRSRAALGGMTIEEAAPGAARDAAARLAATAADWVVIVSSGTALEPGFAPRLARAATAAGTALAFADDDLRDADGRPVEPDFKPGWDEALAFQQDYLGPLLVRRQHLDPARLEAVDERNVRLSVALAASRAEAGIVRVEEVLSHRFHPDRGFEGAALEERMAIVASHLRAVGLGAEVTPRPETRSLAATLLPARWPTVTVVIPTRDNTATLPTALRTLLEGTDYPGLEVVVVDNGSVRSETLALLAETAARDARVTVVRHDRPFNFSELINLGARTGSGELVLLLNDDVEVLDPAWLKLMAAHFANPATGAVGARLLFPDGTIQHAGVALGVGGSVAGHIYLGLPADTGVYRGRARLTRRVSAVTGACLLTRRDLFEEIGGLDEARLSVAYNDIDYCLEVSRRGHSVLYEPRATLVHHESHSRGRDHDPAKRRRLLGEIDHFSAKWGDLVFADPWYNGNLSLFSPHFRFAHPPRRAPD